MIRSRSTRGDALPVSIRLDPDLVARLDRAAARRGLTRSELVRLAVVELVEADDAKRADRSFYDEIAPWVGSLESGRSDGSERTGERFRAALEARRARGPG